MLRIVLVVFLLVQLFSPVCLSQNFTESWPNGKVRLSGDTINGSKDGEWTEWYDTGIVWTKGSYENGEKVGLWKYWYKDNIENKT